MVGRGQRGGISVRLRLVFAGLMLSTIIFLPLIVDGDPPGAPGARFAVIGDYGNNSAAERSVAALVASWNPDFVVTTGDNNYPAGAAETIEANIGQHYGGFFDERFFPALGNHDWQSLKCAAGICEGAYFDYFDLPGNERYYTVLRGPVQIFVLSSDSREPDGIRAESAQAGWLMAELAASNAAWQLVITHHPPYSSARHGPTTALQWPYAAWGADAVLSGHDHVYERLHVDGLTYIVNGAGGASLYEFRTPVPGSVTRYNKLHGAVLVIADADGMVMQFWNVQGVMVDEVRIAR